MRFSELRADGPAPRRIASGSSSRDPTSIRWRRSAPLRARGGSCAPAAHPAPELRSAGTPPRGERSRRRRPHARDHSSKTWLREALGYHCARAEVAGRPVLAFWVAISNAARSAPGTLALSSRRTSVSVQPASSCSMLTLALVSIDFCRQARVAELGGQGHAEAAGVTGEDQLSGFVPKPLARCAALHGPAGPNWPACRAAGQSTPGRCSRALPVGRSSCAGIRPGRWARG
jgi:hypothetical protein